MVMSAPRKSQASPATGKQYVQRPARILPWSHLVIVLVEAGQVGAHDVLVRDQVVLQELDVDLKQQAIQLR